MKTIAIHATAWKRPEITRIAWTALNRVRDQFLEKGYESFVVVGVSEKEHQALAREFGFETIMLPNHPVGLKFNRTARQIVMNYKFDYFMEYCSDNILRIDYVDKVTELIDQGIEYIAMNQFYIADVESKDVLLFGKPDNVKGGISNVGRITPRSLIMKTWRRTNMLYDIRINKRLDRSFHMNHWNLWKVEPHILKDPTPLIVDLKDKDSMNGFDDFKKLIGRFPQTNVVGDFPELSPEFQLDKLPSWQQQENSEVTPSEFTSPQPLETQLSQETTSTTPESALPSETPRPKRKRSSSSRRRRPAASQDPATSSTPQPKTTTDDAKS